MKNCLLSLEEKILLRKRSIVETVFDYLKNKLQLEHSRHRSPVNAFIHIISTLIIDSESPGILVGFMIAPSEIDLLSISFSHSLLKSSMKQNKFVISFFMGRSRLFDQTLSLPTYSYDGNLS